MSKVSVAQFFHSIRSLNGILASAISQVQSAWPKGMPTVQWPSRDPHRPHHEWRRRELADSSLPTLAWRQAAVSLARLAAESSKVVAIEVASSNCLVEFAADFPDRCFTIPPSDPDALAWCADMAAGGQKLVVFATGTAKRDDLLQLVSELCRVPRPLTMLLAAPAVAHDAASEMSTLRRLPNALIMAPADLEELDAMLETSLQLDRPAVVLVSDALAVREGAQAPGAWVPGGDECVGSLPRTAQLALVSCGPLTTVARQAALELSREGIECSVHPLRCLQPLDKEAIAEWATEVRAVIVLEDSLTAGVAGQILDLLATHQVIRPLIVSKSPDDGDRDDAVQQHNRHLQSLLHSCRRLARQYQPRPRPRASRTSAVAALTKMRRRTAGRVGCQQVLEQQLSPTILHWAQAYQGLGPRDLYLWKWGAAGAAMTMLPCVNPQHRPHSCDTKVLSIMFNALLDDVADCREQSGLLPVLMSVVRDSVPRTDGLTDGERRYVEFTCQLWSEYWNRLRTYPCFDAFEELLRYDLTQLFNSIQYSSLLNRHLGLLNCVEHDLYSPHNMMMMTFATVDLMCSPDFDVTELGKLREAMWHAQWMGRIGNLVTTWQREIAAGDFTSGVFARAVASGDLTIDQLQAGDRGQIESAIERGKHQDYYCGRWQYHRRCYLRRANEIHSVDLHALLVGHDRLLETYLESRGFL